MNLRHFYKQRLSIVLLALMTVTTGCINEDLAKCNPTARFTLVVVNAKGDEITEGDAVTNVSLYIFDKDLNYLETCTMDAAAVKSRQEIVLDFTKSDELNIVAWGNMSEKSETVTEAKRIEELKVILKSNNGVAVQADSLYFGTKRVISKDDRLQADDQIVIAPQTGSVKIATIGLQHAINNKLKADADVVCQYVLDRTLNQYTHTGELAGDSVCYNPDAKWVGSEWNTQKYNTYQGENLSISLDANGQTLVDKVKKDDEGNLLSVEKGVTKIITLRFADNGTLISVKTIVRPWGMVIDDIEF